MAITSEALFKYVTEYAAKAESQGRGTTYPTFREVAKRFNASHEAIEQACHDWDQSNGYMQPAVGVRSGTGVAAFEHRGDWLVEAYK